MKTVLQDLIEGFNVTPDETFCEWLREQQNNLLEKEKEQIIDAYRIASINNSPSDDIQNIRPEYWQVNAEMWYDKHYNQNK